MRLLRIIFLGLIVWLTLTINGVGSELDEDPLRPLEVVGIGTIRILENVNHCNAGYGTQQSIFQISNQQIRSKEDSNPYFPKFKPYNTPYLSAGCQWRHIYAYYSLIDDAFRLDSDVEKHDKIYNSISYHQEVLAAGYSFSLLPHLLHLNIGLGFQQLYYNLGYYGVGDAEDEYESKQFRSNGFVAQAALRVFVTHFFSVVWRQQKSLESGSTLDYFNQLS